MCICCINGLADFIFTCRVPHVTLSITIYALGRLLENVFPVSQAKEVLTPFCDLFLTNAHLTQASHSYNRGQGGC